MAALCVCCGESKIGFHSLRSKKRTLYENKINNQILGEFKFRFKSSEKKKKHSSTFSSDLLTRLFLSENDRVVTKNERLVRLAWFPGPAMLRVTRASWTTI